MNHKWMPLLCLLLFSYAVMLLPNAAHAAPPKSRAKVLTGAPVNVNTAGGGTLPQGKMLNMLSISFADKDNAKRGGDKAPDMATQVYLLKIRYGITNNLEFSTVGGYINLHKSNPSSAPENINGLTDQSLQLSYAFMNEHQGDPVSFSIGAALLVPTGLYGKNHLGGNGAFGYRTSIGLGKFVTPDIKIDNEIVYTGPFEKGNQNIKRGEQFQWNAHMRYLFDNFDIGFESSLVHQASSRKSFNKGDMMGPGVIATSNTTASLRNGYTEWFIGPSVNAAIDPLDMWVGAGIFFPVLQDVDGPTKVEDARFEFKIGKLW